MQREYKISLSQEFYSDVVYLSQYDSDYDVIFKVMNKLSAVDVDGKSAKFTGTRKDGLGFTFETTGTGSYVSFEINTSLTAVAGHHTAEIVFYDSQGLYFGSANVQVVVEPAARKDGTIDADTERAQEIAEEIQEIVDNAAAEVKGEAESWAVGERDGEPVPATDPAYNNNAKYYAQQAAQIAEDISGVTEQVAQNTSDIGDLNEDLNVVTEEHKEYLFSSDAVSNRYWDSATNKAITNRLPRVAYDVQIPVTAGTTYYWKYINPMWSWYMYDDESTGAFGTTNAIIESGTFIAENDGYVVITSDEDHKSIAIFTDSEIVYENGEQKSRTVFVTDDTLTDPTKAANAKAAGNRITAVETALSAIGDVNNIYTKSSATITDGNAYDSTYVIDKKCINQSGAIVDTTSTKYIKIPVPSGVDYVTYTPGNPTDINLTATNFGCVLMESEDTQTEATKYFYYSYKSEILINGSYVYKFPIPTGTAYFCANVKMSVYDGTNTAVIIFANVQDGATAGGQITQLRDSTLCDIIARNGIADLTERVKGRLYGKKVTVIGDSITEHNYRAKTNWAMYLAQNTGCTIQNLGGSGQGFHRGNYHYSTKIQNIDANTDIIGVAASFNDCVGSSQVIGTVDDTTSDDTVLGYVNDFFAALITAFPITPIICYVQNPWNAFHFGVEKSDAYISGVKTLCERYGVPFDESMYKGSVLRPWILANREAYFTSDDDTDERYGTVDDTHPNSTGHVFIEARLRKMFEENVR